MVILEQPKLNFSSKTENINLVEHLVDSVCEEYKVNEDYYGNILVAVTEAVTNAIQHGNKYDSTKTINVEFTGKEEDLLFIVSDQGTGFDYENLPDPTEPENIEKAHGRGIFLMKHLADEVEFKANGRVVELSFNVAS